jgi:glucose/arabinose dehydrogenase
MVSDRFVRRVVAGLVLGVAVDRTGALLVADDVGNVVWRVHQK